jgi:hypothetical protein
MIVDQKLAKKTVFLTESFAQPPFCSILVIARSKATWPRHATPRHATAGLRFARNDNAEGFSKVSNCILQQFGY